MVVMIPVFAQTYQDPPSARINAPLPYTVL